MGGVFQRQNSKDSLNNPTPRYAPRTSTSKLFDFTACDLPDTRKMSVIGIDLGSQSCYVATARAGGIELILNDYSMRDTPSAVAFHDTNRSMGVAARNNLVGNLKNTVFNMKRLLGRDFSDASVQEEKQYLTYDIEEKEGGGVGIKVTYMGKEEVFVPEQVCGMLLGKLKEISEVDLRVPVSDCVISVPSYYTDVERRALLAAAQIAGLNVLRIMNDTTAVALSYGLYSQELPEADQPPMNIVFVDVGYCSTQLASVAYNKGKLKVLSTVTDADLGGRNLDYALVRHFAAEFKEKYKMDVFSNKRATVRLRDECEKLKKMMSSISNEIPLNIECFMNDKDVSGKMKREDFEVLIADYLNRTEGKFRELLSSLKGAELHKVEIVGAGVRVPALKALIKKVFGLEATTSLNQDEAVARGCAIQCAILSPTLKVKEFLVGDVCPYGIELRWPADRTSQAGNLEVFPRNHAIPFSKIVTFNRNEPFVLEAYYSASHGTPKNTPWIGKFRVLDVKPAPGEVATKVRIKSRIGLNGLFSVPNAYREEVVLVEEDAPNVQIQPMDTDDGKEGDASEKPDLNKMETEEQEGGEKQQKKTKKQSKQIELRVEAEYREYSAKAIQTFVEMENEMRSQDKAEKEKADARNALEEYIYEARDKVGGDHADYVLESDREKFSTLLREAEDWLYGEGEDQPKSSYAGKLADLQSHGNPIAARYREAQERPVLFEEMSRYMQLTRKAVDAYKSGDEKLAHLDSKDVDKVMKMVEEKQQWLDEKMNAQSKRGRHLEPTVTTAQIRKEKESMERLINPILNKPKPKPAPPKPQEPPKDSATKTAESAENAASGDAEDDVPMD